MLTFFCVRFRLELFVCRSKGRGGVSPPIQQLPVLETRLPSLCVQTAIGRGPELIIGSNLDLQILENNNWARDFGQTGWGRNKATQLVDSVLPIVWRNENGKISFFLFWGCKMKFCRGFSYFGKSLKPTN